MPTINDYIKIEEQKEKERVKVSKNGNFSIKNEFVATFSNRKSFFSSKKIERFITFITFLTLSIIYISMNIKSLSATEFIEVVGLWLAYGGYNSFQIHRDKKLETQNESE